MPTLTSGFATFAVTAIYFVWRVWFQAQLEQQRAMAKRVTYMLWVMANQAEALPGDLDGPEEPEAGNWSLGHS